MTSLILKGLLTLSTLSGQWEVHPTHEDLELTGQELYELNHALQNMSANEKLFVEIDGRFFAFDEVQLPETDEPFTVQITSPTGIPKDYNDRYLPYYRYSRVQSYLTSKQEALSSADYIMEKIGESLSKRDLYAIYPRQLSDQKKTVVMLGRQHGDEGSQNWIIEGFLNQFFAGEDWRDEFQLIAYPMINPDGAEAHTRYNANRRDLNRWWKASGNYDQEAHEVALVHKHLDQLLGSTSSEVVIFLDMHGSFHQDFLFRVYEDFISKDYFAQQSQFIDKLGEFDSWQRGQFRLSNGNPGMSRIVMARRGFNALTHESIRDIPKGSGRSVETLYTQGDAIFKAIWQLYR